MSLLDSELLNESPLGGRADAPQTVKFSWTIGLALVPTTDFKSFFRPVRLYRPMRLDAWMFEKIVHPVRVSGSITPRLRMSLPGRALVKVRTSDTEPMQLVPSLDYRVRHIHRGPFGTTCSLVLTCTAGVFSSDPAPEDRVSTATASSRLSIARRS